MPIIEFVGMPCSGKSTSYYKIKEQFRYKNQKVLSYMDLFYIYSSKITKLSILEKFSLYISYYQYQKNISNKKYNTKKFPEKKLAIKYFNYFKISTRKLIYKNINNIKQRIIKNFNKDEKKLYSILKKSIECSPLDFKEQLILKSRIQEELIGISIYKKLKLKNLLIFNDEGLLQRILSGFKKNNFQVKNISYLLRYQAIEYIFYTKALIKTLKKRSKIRKNGFKYDVLTNNDIIKWQRIYKLFNKKFNKDIYKVKNNISATLLKKIIKK